jgi:hypothetical protein
MRSWRRRYALYASPTARAGSTTTIRARQLPYGFAKSPQSTGDYNKDLTTSSTVGDVWTSSFTGTGVAVYAPKETGAGRIEIQIDGQTSATVDLSTTGARQAQQLVSEVSSLTSGQHTISIINRGPGPVAVDAIVAR